MKKCAVLIITTFVITLNCYAGEFCSIAGGVNSACEIKSESEAPVGAVTEISYDDFAALKKSNEPFVVIDVLSAESFAKGHIDGAKSLPLETITEESAQTIIPSKDTKVIVYCGSFQCLASTQGAKKLMELGYKALDYKGGLKEWQEKGNSLVK